MVNRPAAFSAFEFAVLSGLRAAQLMRGCLPRVEGIHKTIVTALAKGKRVVVKGDPQKGPATTDTYVLAGFPKALALIDKACGVKR